MNGLGILESVAVGGRLRAGTAALVPWWSIGKTALAAAALALVRDGRLGLAAPFRGRPYTLRQLLNHTAGVPCYGPLPDYKAAVAGGDAPWPLGELLDRVQPDNLRSAPGAQFRYSNVGYLFVRQAIEEATGLPLNDALARLVFAPLYITDVRSAETPDDLAACAWGNAARYDPRWVYHGLLIGPPASAVLFLDRLLGGDLLPSFLMADMLTPFRVHEDLPGRPFVAPGYGLGLMIDSNGRHGRMIGHTGGGPGSTCAAYHFPDLAPARTAAAFAPGDAAGSDGVVENRVLALAGRRAP
jgi:CubicO group peptidase (beta-lactamase class C family)